MMWDEGYWMHGWGMYWWMIVVGVVALTTFLILLVNQLRSRAQIGGPETPMEILERRYARGDLTDEEFEEKRRQLRHEAEPTEQPPEAPTGGSESPA